MAGQQTYTYTNRPQKIFITKTPVVTKQVDLGIIGISTEYFIPDHSIGTGAFQYSTDSGSTWSNCTLDSPDSGANVKNFAGKGRKRKVMANWKAFEDLLPQSYSDIRIRATVKDSDNDAMTEGTGEYQSKFPVTTSIDLSVNVVKNVALPFSDSGTLEVIYYIPYVLKEVKLKPELIWSTSSDFSASTTVTAWDYETNASGTFSAGDNAGVACPDDDSVPQNRFKQSITSITAETKIYYKINLIPIEFT